MRFRKTLTFFVLTMGLVFTLPAGAQQKPMTQNQVQALVRDGFGDESGAKVIERLGIDFAPADDFLQTLKAAGASEAFLKALRAAKPPESASVKKPLNQVQVFALLAGGVPSHRVAILVKERGIDFDVKDDYLQELRLGGGDEELINALKSTKVTKPDVVDPAAEAQQAEVRRHVTRMAELERKGRYTEAEQECRLALSLDPQNADLQKDLTYILGQHTTARQYYSELIEHASSFGDFVKLAGPGSFGPRSSLVCFPNDPLSLPDKSRSDTDFFIISPSTPDYLRDEVGAEESELLFQQDLELQKGLLLEISKTPPAPAFLAKLSKGFLVINHFDRGIGGGFIVVLPLYSGFDFRESLGTDATVWTLAKWTKEDYQLAVLKMVNDESHKNIGHLSADFKLEPATGRFIFGLMIDDEYFSTNQRFGVCELVRTKDGRNPADAYPYPPAAK